MLDFTFSRFAAFNSSVSKSTFDSGSWTGSIWFVSTKSCSSAILSSITSSKPNVLVQIMDNLDGPETLYLVQGMAMGFEFLNQQFRHVQNQRAINIRFDLKNSFTKPGNTVRSVPGKRPSMACIFDKRVKRCSFMEWTSSAIWSSNSCLSWLSNCSITKKRLDCVGSGLSKF